MKLIVVTATTNLTQALPCIRSWRCAEQGLGLVIVINGGPRIYLIPDDLVGMAGALSIVYADEYLGTVPAFNRGVTDAFAGADDAEIYACLHDDLEILDPDWAKKVETLFKRHPSCGLAGFGGAIGLGDPEIYQKPYAPMQLARVGFRSNMPEAEKHGIRSMLPERVACLDGFSQIGRREFFLGIHNPETRPGPEQQPWQALEDIGIIHHFYDGALGCLAARYGWETWYLPIACQHYGGRTAVGDTGYQAWAQATIPGGDHGFWEQAHKHGYEEFRDVLPLRV